MPERNSEYVYQPPAKFTEELRQRINNASFSDEFKQQIKSAQKKEGRKMFERLTNPKHGGIRSMRLPLSNQAEIYQRLAAYEDSGLSPEEVQKLKKSDASKERCTIDQHGEIRRLRDELKRYKQAEQEGRLYNLPLKPGDTIYRLEALQFCWVITKVEIYEDEIVFIDDSDNIFRPDDIGKTVFLTREAAERRLRRRG